MKQYSRKETWGVCKSHVEGLVEEHEVRSCTLFFHSAVRRLLVADRERVWKFFHLEDRFSAEGVEVLLQLMVKIEPEVNWAADREAALATLTAKEIEADAFMNNFMKALEQ